MQFIGSMVACARNGSSYSAFESVALREALGDVADAILRLTPSFLLAARKSSQISFELNLALRALVPGNDESVETLLGRPHVVADDRDQIVEHDDLSARRGSVLAALSST